MSTLRQRRMQSQKRKIFCEGGVSILTNCVVLAIRHVSNFLLKPMNHGKQKASDKDSWSPIMIACSTQYNYGENACSNGIGCAWHYRIFNCQKDSFKILPICGTSHVHVYGFTSSVTVQECLIMGASCWSFDVPCMEILPLPCTSGISWHPTQARYSLLMLLRSHTISQISQCMDDLPGQTVMGTFFIFLA